MATVKDFYDFINSAIAPFAVQESWDNSGLLLGDEAKEVKRVALSLDATRQTVAAAKDFSADLFITHHPVLFSPVKSIKSGDLPYAILSAGMSQISMHTNLDTTAGGVNDVLCEKLGFTDFAPMEDLPMVRLSHVQPMSGEELARLTAERLDCHLRLADAGKPITNVAVCGGACSSFIPNLIDKADAFITGDLSHHSFLDAVHGGLTAIAAGHFETEAPVMAALKSKLEKQFTEVDYLLINQENPVKYY